MRTVKLIALLCFIALSSVACSKKDVPVGVAPSPSATTNQMASIDAASRAITDGVVYFAFNRYDIAPEYRQILNQKAAIMRQYPSIRVRIEGNCDARGTREYNLALGERRARAAYEYLVRLGVNPNQIEIISYGKERPAVAGTGEQVWALNRRNDFRIISR